MIDRGNQQFYRLSAPLPGTFLWRVFWREFVGSMTVQRRFCRRCSRIHWWWPVRLRIRAVVVTVCRMQAALLQGAECLCYARLQTLRRWWSGFCGCWNVWECRLEHCSVTRSGPSLRWMWCGSYYVMMWEIATEYADCMTNDGMDMEVQRCDWAAEPGGWWGVVWSAIDGRALLCLMWIK